MVYQDGREGVCWNSKEDSDPCQQAELAVLSEMHLVQREQSRRFFGVTTLPTEESVSEPLPDFIVRKTWLETPWGAEVYQYGLGESFKLKAQSENIGSGSCSGDITGHVYLSKGQKEDLHSGDNAWRRINTSSTPCSNLKPEDTHTETESTNIWEWIDTPGIYNIVYCIDHPRDDHNNGGDYPEEHESNNCSTEAVFEVTSDNRVNFENCDLTVLSVYLEGSHPVPSDGKMSASMTILNQGEDAPSSAIRSSYSIFGPGTNGQWQQIADDGTDSDQLAPGIIKTESILTPVPAPTIPGTYTLRACADYQNAIPETNEGNNCATSSFEVRMYRPDFTITQLGLTGGRSSLLQGDRFGLSTIIKNQGNAGATKDIRSAYYLLPPGTSTWQYKTDDLTTAVQMCAGCEKVEWNTNEPYTANVPGTWQGRVCADYQNSVSELDEGNNCRTFSFSVAPAGSDLIVSSLGNKEGTTIKKGSYIHPWCIVKNVGNKTPNSDSRFAYYIDGERRTDDFVGASQLNPGQEKREEVKSNIIKLGNTGTRTYTCCADFQGSVFELNEGNNCASITIQVVK